MYKELLIKYAQKQRTNAMREPKLSKDWGEGEDIEIDGPDRQLRMKMDNYLGGNRWHPFQNKFIKMKRRRNTWSQPTS